LVEIAALLEAGAAPSGDEGALEDIVVQCIKGIASTVADADIEVLDTVQGAAKVLAKKVKSGAGGVGTAVKSAIDSRRSESALEGAAGGLGSAGSAVKGAVHANEAKNSLASRLGLASVAGSVLADGALDAEGVLPEKLTAKNVKAALPGAAGKSAARSSGSAAADSPVQKAPSVLRESFSDQVLSGEDHFLQSMSGEDGMLFGGGPTMGDQAGNFGGTLLVAVWL
jgi:hypothetical protein